MSVILDARGVSRVLVDPNPVTLVRDISMTVDAGQNYNHYFPGNKIMMPKPLGDGQVTYTDGAPQTVDQYAKDVSAFLMWMAEPKLDERKKTGFRVLVVLAILAGLLYASKRKVWSGVHH